MDINIMYLAIVFFCKGTTCGLISIETPYSNRAECEAEVEQAEKKFRQDRRLTIVEGRCIHFNNGIKT